MTTGKDYGLPEEYADWVLKKLEDGVDGAQSSFIRVTFERLDGIPGHDRRAQVVMWAYLFPPKPKPTLPDVKPGAVVRYVDHDGDPVRVIRMALGYRETWIDMHQNRYTNAALLADVDDDGFTVELDGLE